MPRSPATAPFARAGRACPTCGAATEEDQLVCLECGSRVALGYRRPPSWRVPVAIIAAVVLLVAAASAIALAEIGDDAEREAARTPIDVKRGTEGKPGASAQSGLIRQGSLYRWPPELGGFTVVLLRTEDRAEADDFARRAAEDRPAKIGVIRADDFTSLENGFFLVFAGRYAGRGEAERAADRLGGRFPDAFPQRID
ncbi:MAG: SPOR domain-containing protein [Actinomycetota bacterium]|nr:SPOR domain-containing protein [Actinomycetota bacterium]